MGKMYTLIVFQSSGVEIILLVQAQRWSFSKVLFSTNFSI